MLPQDNLLRRLDAVESRVHETRRAITAVLQRAAIPDPSGDLMRVG